MAKKRSRKKTKSDADVDAAEVAGAMHAQTANTAGLAREQSARTATAAKGTFRPK